MQLVNVSLCRSLDVELLTKRGNQITHWPEDRKQRQQISRSLWQKFQEQCAINGQVTTDTKSNASIECASTNPGGATTGSKTEGTGKEKGEVESKTATEDVRCSAPERSTYAETEEERKSRIADFSLAYAKLSGKLWQGKRDTLKP